MSKIICDICGTSYPETAKQCPICGSVRPGDVQRVTNEVRNDGKGSTGYTHVKAGHFTKSNVKKRTKDSGGKPASQKSGGFAGHDKDNRGLIITAIVLLLAVIGVVIYIAIGLNNEPPANLDEGKITCKDLKVPVDVRIAEVGGTLQLEVTKVPENCEEKIEFSISPYSQYPDVVEITQDGLITAKREGEAVIEIKCGTIVKTIVVKVGTSSTETTPGGNGGENNNGENPGGNGETVDELRFVQYELKLTTKGSTSALYAGDIPKSEIIWTSDNTAVATFVDGVVTAVGEGTTVVRAEYNGQKAECTVTCEFGNTGGQTGSGGVTEDGGSTGGVGLYTAKITGDEVRIRSTPEAKVDLSNAVGYLLLNDQVTVYEERTFGNDTWCRISSDSETSQRWVYGAYVQKIAN